MSTTRSTPAASERAAWSTASWATGVRDAPTPVPARSSESRSRARVRNSSRCRLDSEVSRARSVRRWSVGTRLGVELAELEQRRTPPHRLALLGQQQPVDDELARRTPGGAPRAPGRARTRRRRRGGTPRWTRSTGATEVHRAARPRAPPASARAPRPRRAARSTRSYSTLPVQRGALDVDRGQRRSSHRGSHHAQRPSSTSTAGHERHPDDVRVDEDADREAERDRLDGGEPPGMNATKTLVMISAAAVTTRDEARKPLTTASCASPVARSPRASPRPGTSRSPSPGRTARPSRRSAGS